VKITRLLITFRLAPCCLNIHKYKIWCVFVRALLYMRREVNQLDATEWFIAIIICPTCFGHIYAHHQEFETIHVLLPHMVCNALVPGGRRSRAGQQLCIRDEGSCSTDSSTNCNENPSSRSWVVLWGQANITKIIVAFRNFVKVLKNICHCL
jgi:hypothetical protein